MTFSRMIRLGELLSKYRGRWHGDGGVPGLTLDCRYVLIEQNWRYARGYWLTSAVTLDTAAAAHLGQEYAEEWELLGCLDLDTGMTWFGEVRIDWQLAE
jgi:hypothetical protein